MFNLLKNQKHILNNLSTENKIFEKYNFFKKN